MKRVRNWSLATAVMLLVLGTCAVLVVPGVALSKPKPKLVAVTITPASATLPQGGYTRQFTATGEYDDGSSADLTTAVSWTSSNTTVAVDATGKVTSGSTAGSATITARTTTGKKVTGSASITVSAISLVQLTIEPESPYVDPLFLAEGDVAKLDAIGQFSDGSTMDISADVTWSSNSTPTASVDNVGHVTGVTTGTAVITARRGTTIGDVITVNVTDA